MAIDFKIVDERAKAPVVENNSINLKCIDILTEVGKDMRMILIYRTGLSISIPDGHVGILTPVRIAPIYSLKDAAGMQVFYPGDDTEIVARYKVDTMGVPAIFEIDEVFARMVIVKVAEEVTLNEVAPEPVGEVEGDKENEQGTDIQGAESADRDEQVADSE